jgi:hypothetical protein
MAGGFPDPTTGVPGPSLNGGVAPGSAYTITQDVMVLGK